MRRCLGEVHRRRPGVLAALLAGTTFVEHKLIIKKLNRSFDIKKEIVRSANVTSRNLGGALSFLRQDVRRNDQLGNVSEVGRYISLVAIK